eukprot:COSAG02_NODE_3531_length_6606_cov_67.718611_6_plen_48_part_00
MIYSQLVELCCGIFLMVTFCEVVAQCGLLRRSVLRQKDLMCRSTTNV